MSALFTSDKNSRLAAIAAVVVITVTGLLVSGQNNSKLQKQLDATTSELVSARAELVAVTKERDALLQEVQELRGDVSTVKTVLYDERMRHGLFARGIRAHNPGNIVKTGITWQGEVECTDKVHECFESAEYGIRAMVLNLASYQLKYNLHTPREILHRWAEANAENYAKFVANYVGVGIDDDIDLLDNGHGIKFVEGMILFENQVQPYEPAVIERGWELATEKLMRL